VQYGYLLESIDWGSSQKHIGIKQLKQANIVARLLVPPIARGSMNVPAIVAKPNPFV
jgi:hypothetical protein